MPDGLDRTDNAAYLTTVFSCLGPYEKEIICEIAQRLLAGQRQYGQFRDLDNRDFGIETRQELLDAIIYTTRLSQRIA